MDIRITGNAQVHYAMLYTLLLVRLKCYFSIPWYTVLFTQSSYTHDILY